MGMLKTPAGRAIPENAVIVETVRSGGPGGQHANKTETGVRVRLDLGRLDLDEEELQRLGGRVIEATARTSRSQIRNKESALDTALRRLDDALAVPRRRKPTRPSKAASEKRLRTKRRQAQRKTDRRTHGDD